MTIPEHQAHVTITHTHAEGTLLTGTTKGDGIYQILRPLGWRWGRSIDAFYLPRSRDRDANPHKITAIELALRDAGHEVTVTIDDTWRPAAQVEADKVARQAARAAALDAKAGRARAAVDAADLRVASTLDRLPDNGQPVLVGHHSERGHRAAIARADRAMAASIAADTHAAEVDRRAAVAHATTGARYSPAAVGNRIDKLEADIRRVRRELDGHTVSRGTP